MEAGVGAQDSEQAGLLLLLKVLSPRHFPVLEQSVSCCFQSSRALRLGGLLSTPDTQSLNQGMMVVFAERVEAPMSLHATYLSGPPTCLASIATATISQESWR